MIQNFNEFQLNEAFGLSDKELIKELQRVSNISSKIQSDFPKIIKDIEELYGKIKYTNLDISCSSGQKTHEFYITVYFSLNKKQREDWDLFKFDFKEKQDLVAANIAKKYNWQHGTSGNIGDKFTFIIK